MAQKQQVKDSNGKRAWGHVAQATAIILTLTMLYEFFLGPRQNEKIREILEPIATRLRALESRQVALEERVTLQTEQIRELKEAIRNR